MDTIKFSIKDYTLTPGGRFIKNGLFSGEDFKNSKLKPLFLEASSSKKKLLIDLDGTYGYPSSFLEEAFGGLSREYGEKAVCNTLIFKSDEDLEEIDRIFKYIAEAGGSHEMEKK